MTVRIVWNGSERLKEIDGSIEKSMLVVAKMVETAAKKKVSEKGKGRVYRKYNPKRTHQASGEGDPPATDTGYLKSNIVGTAKGKTAIIESRAKYSFWLEFGTSRMAARPFLWPAYKETRDKAIKKIAEYVKRATG
jgi:HK97 gp10 family phage protein